MEVNVRRISIPGLSSGRSAASPIAGRAGFAALFDSTHIVVFRYVRAMGGTGLSAEDVEDITAEVFLRAWRMRGGFRGDEDAALGWLLVIARRLVIDAWRTRQRRPTDATAPDVLDTLAGHRHGQPEEHVLADERRRELLERMGLLPESQREMIALRYALGWQVQKIAGHMGMSENAASVALSRAVRRLAKAHQESEVDHE